METVNYITDEVKALIGRESDWEEAWDPVQSSEVRRHIQAIMDPDPIYWNEEYAASTKMGGVVAPPLFPMHAWRRPPGTPDPFDAAISNPDYDGSQRGVIKGLPPVVVPLTRLLNGGNQVEIYQLARTGERIRTKTKYRDIYQKDGRSGVMIFVIMETEYQNEKGETLLKSTMTRIIR